MSLQHIQIDALANRLREMENRWRKDVAAIEAKPVSAAVAALRRGRVHEWFADDAPAVAIFTDAARHAWRDRRGLIVWVGRAVQPYPAHLDDAALGDCVLIDPPDDAARLWAIDLALRSGAVTAVAADGARLRLRETRRLQLAAEAGAALVLLARPIGELPHRSAAAYRWRVEAAPSDGVTPRWRVTLVRSKDAADATWSGKTKSTIVEWRHDQGLVVVPAVVADRAAAPALRIA